MFELSRIYNPFIVLPHCKKHENEKKQAYEQRVQEVELVSFIPLVLSASWGLAKQATVLNKSCEMGSIIQLDHEKWDHSYRSTMNWL